MSVENTYTISLTAKPIWLQQPEENEQQYAAFMAWCTAEKYQAPAKTAKEHNLTHWVVYRNKWQERADVYHEEINKRISMGVAQAYERLEVRSIETAHELLDQGTVEETEERTKNNDGSVTVKRTKTRMPSERLTAQLLQGIKEKAHDTGSIDFEEILRTMVEDTEPRSTPPADTGVEEQPGET